MKIIATLPDGETKPLLWLYGIRRWLPTSVFHRELVNLPIGTVIRGLSIDSPDRFDPGKKRKAN